MSIQSQRLASTLHRVVQTVLDRELSDPRLESRITVTEVQMYPDGNTAVIGVMVTPETKGRLVMAALDSASAHIRRRIGDKLPDTRLPRLQFRLDKTVRRRDAALEAIARAEAERRGAAGGEPTPTDAEIDEPDIHIPIEPDAINEPPTTRSPRREHDDRSRQEHQ